MDEYKKGKEDKESTYITDGTVVSGLHVVLAVVAGVDELVLALVVQLVQHAQRAELGAPHRRELKVLVAGHRQKGVAPVHEVTVHERIGILNRLWMECGDDEWMWCNQLVVGLNVRKGHPSIDVK